MTKLLYRKDDLDKGITEEYELHVDSKWLLKYIVNNTECESVAEFSNWCISADVEEIINELGNSGVAYSYNKTGRHCDIDDLM